MPRLTNKPRKRRDGRYEARLSVLEDGRRVRISVYGATAAEAERLAREIKTRAERGQFSRDKTTVVGFAETWLSRKKKEVRPSTLDSYRRELSLALPSLKDPEALDDLGSRKLQEVKPSHIRALIDDLMERYSLRTVRWVRQKLHTLFEEALNLELVYRNPVSPVKIKAPRGQTKTKTGRALEPHEVQALLAALDAHKDRRTALALRLMLAAGLRLGEALGLQWDDLDFEAGTLTVRRAWSAYRLTGPKTPTSARTVPIPFATLERLKAYRQWWAEKLGVTPPGAMWVFAGNDPSKPLDYNAPGHALRRIIDGINAKRQKEAEKAGVEPVLFPPTRVHDLRHSFGSHLLANGAPLELVAERMGHANPNVTLGVYRHLLQHEKKGWIIDPEDLTRPSAKA
ncbi:Transposase [Calidithermus terrae]|uniref:Transposase n=1 Tax=Calidithermus terrae TaxID=1408545 RepID=A0A399F8B8_9DEIN|nr:tyrosine-type recombinase/integrase [Calidithermus terrae]RIH90881.1 Transposase [Calidithermus terrae]